MGNGLPQPGSGTVTQTLLHSALSLVGTAQTPAHLSPRAPGSPPGIAIRVAALPLESDTSTCHLRTTGSGVTHACRCPSHLCSAETRVPDPSLPQPFLPPLLPRAALQTVSLASLLPLKRGDVTLSYARQPNRQLDPFVIHPRPPWLLSATGGNDTPGPAPNLRWALGTFGSRFPCRRPAPCSCRAAGTVDVIAILCSPSASPSISTQGCGLPHAAPHLGNAPAPTPAQICFCVSVLACSKFQRGARLLPWPRSGPLLPPGRPAL